VKEFKPQMNADEHRLKTGILSALICVYLRSSAAQNVFFTASQGVVPEEIAKALTLEKTVGIE
jgi:hypothetical protein